MESRCGGQMENIQHMARVECVTAGKVRLFSENTQVSSGSPGFALNNIFYFSISGGGEHMSIS